MPQNEKIILALDPFAKMPALANAAKSVKALARQGKYQVQVASVISPDELQWPQEFSGSWENEFEKVGTKALQKISKKMNLPPSPPPKTLMQLFHSKKTSAQSILNLAKQQQARMIVTLTHANKEKASFLLGSFVESLMGLSQLPVLAINASAKPLKNVKTILFPSDFSRACLKSFKKTVALAASLKADIIILHKLTTPMDPNIADGASFVGGMASVETFLQAHEKKALAWEKLAKKSGVKTKTFLSRDFADTNDLILKVSKNNNVDLIAMTAQTGRIASVFLGSITKSVLRSSTLPVLIMKGN